MIRPLDDADLPRALEIAQDGVGRGWAEPADLAPHPWRRVVVCEDDGEIAGVATGGLRSAVDLLRHRDQRVGRALAGAGITERGTVLVLDLAAVTPAARRHGHYRALLDDRVAWGARKGAGHAIAFGWTPPDGCHIAPAMERAGFVRRAQLPGFFHRSSVETGALCPHCGNPCDCSAVVFTRPIGPRPSVRLAELPESPASGDSCGG